nr:tripartite tricarboxylate transporter permease [uncultured Oscillibacter sp.]
MLQAFAVGASVVFQPISIVLMIAGVIVGIIFGAIPGLSATMAIALCLPITYGMEAAQGMVLLVSLYIGGISGGLISAILMHIPGTPSSVATCFDGHPLTMKGQGAKALGVGIVFSFIGTLFSTVILIFLSPALARIAIKFSAYEYFAVALFSLTMMSSLSGKSLCKGLVSGLFGCMLATVGLDAIGSVQRFTFGIQSLRMGFSTLPVLVGLFAVSEIIKSAESAATEPEAEILNVDIRHIKGFGFSLSEFVSQKWNALMCALIGTGIGILPGIGGGAANVLAYSVSKNRSKYPEKYGTGIIDGVVASETSNNASIGGALVPMLALGIPGDPATAMLLAGLTLQGIAAGPLMFTQNVDIVYSIFLTMLIGSFLMLLLEFYGLRAFVSLLKIPKQYLLPGVFLFCMIGAYGSRNNIFDVWTVLFMGTIGFIFTKLDIPAPPFILGLLIGPLAEMNLRRGIMMAKGNFLMFFTRPIAVVFFVLTAISLAFAIHKQVKAMRKKN